MADFDVHCEWGLKAIEHLAPRVGVVVIVDVLSFSTSVDVAVSRGAEIFPFNYNDDSAGDFAKDVDAALAYPRGAGTPSLSPASLLEVEKGQRFVLPSINGSTLSLATGELPTLCGCLRNAAAVAEAALAVDSRVAVIPAGEKWTDGKLRPSLEDILGAGAIIEHLAGALSPDARAARAVFREFRGELRSAIADSASGRELIAGGFEDDIDLATELNASRCAPTLVSRRFIDGAA